MKNKRTMTVAINYPGQQELFDQVENNVMQWSFQEHSGLGYDLNRIVLRDLLL